MKSITLKIGTRLLLGFSIVVILTILFGIISLRQFGTLTSFTERMHDHPMAVSNAVRDILTGVARIQFNLQKYLNVDDPFEMQLMFVELDTIEDDITKNFKVIGDRFLGDMTDVDRAKETYESLKPHIKEVVTLFQSDRKTEAIEMIENNNIDIILERLSEQVEVMSLFAHGKSEEFYFEARASGGAIIRTTIIFLIMITFISLLIGSLISLSVTRPLTTLIQTIKEMAIGNNDLEIEVKSNDETGQLAVSLKEMQSNLKDVIIHAGKIATGDYTGSIPLRSDSDKLAKSLNLMTKSLKEFREANAYQDWLKTGQNMLSEKMRGDLSIGELSERIITSLAEYVDAPVGALYVYDEENKRLKLIASYAYSKRKSLSQSFDLGEGLVGQVALEMKLISIRDIPEDYLMVSSGLGESNPSSVVAFPFAFNSRLKGVIELGSFGPWTDRELELFNSIADMIGVSFSSSEARSSMEKLVKQQEEQAQELQAANEELEEKTERLTSSEEILRSQQEELKATNEELEEKTEHLQNQKDEIDRKNQELQIVQQEIIEKAKDLENSSRYKSEFLANMSHELRTPLNSLLILAKDLMNNRSGSLSEREVESAEIIYSSGNELLQLINEILDLAKIESGKMTMSIESVKMTDLMDNMQSLFGSMAEKKGIGLSFRTVFGSPESVDTDRQKLGQILKNLLSNAVKFTSEGIVELKAGSAGADILERVKNDYGTGAVYFEVADSGIGIAEEDIPHIFDAFKQVDGSSSREYGGTGLGLSISRELAALLGGEILLTSRPGEGSVFTLVLPFSIESQSIEKIIHADNPEKEELPLSIAGENGHFLEDDREDIGENDKVLLLIEDDRNFAKILYKTCKEMNFKTIVAGTGESGLELVEAMKPDAIILDIKLPGIDGMQVLERLKLNRETRHIPVHLMSVDDKEEELKGKGVLGFIRKPVDRPNLEKMLSKITTFLNKEVKDLLIVEDNKNLRKSIELLIGNGDVVKTSVSTGSEALEKIGKTKFDCMILDLSLPDMSGFELLELLDKEEGITKPPVVVYTGRELSFDEELELRKYTSSVIIKGVQSEERLLDETSLFLHRVVSELPRTKQKLISKVYNKEMIFKDKRILIVDDDMRNLFAVSKIIEEQGMVPVKSVNGRKALDFLESGEAEVDLILMDIMMPVMDGYEAMRAIRKNKKIRDIPILALTAKAMSEDRQKCLEAGANDYMVKPVDPDRLLSLMRVWLYK